MRRADTQSATESSRSVGGGKRRGIRLTVHLNDGVGDLDLVERHGRPAGFASGIAGEGGGAGGGIGLVVPWGGR
uniref:Uncharacterized protein n=1 Tax=Arundo donax TaxID=35708 RepID=A0A0A9DN88_ARUDO